MPKNKNVHLTNIANIFTDYTIVKKSVDDIRIDQSHPRKVTEKQKEKAARLIHQTGFIMPVIIDEKGHIVIGQEWYEGAKIIGLEKIPVIITTNLTDVEIRLIRIGYPKIQELGEFDH